MKTVAFYSYKGGVGRSLVVANFARYLARFGQHVLALDMDLEAPGLHHKFCLGEERQSLCVKKGLTDYLAEFQDSNRTPEDLQDYLIDVTPASGSLGRITLFPAGNVSGVDYWRKLAGLDWHEFFFTEGAKGVELFLDLKARLEQQLKPDYLLIDTRTGITEIGGVATNLLPDVVVCLMLNNPENLEGMRVVVQSIARKPEVYGGEAIDVVPVIARLPGVMDSDEERILLNELASELARPVGTQLKIEVQEPVVLHADPEMQRRERILVDGRKRPEDSTLLRDYLKLFGRIVPPESISQHIEPLIEKTMGRMLDDPENAQLDLEALADYSGTETSFRALVKFYRLRNVVAPRLLDSARKWWTASNGRPDPIHWEVVRTSFIPYLREHGERVSPRMMRHHRMRHNRTLRADSSPSEPENREFARHVERDSEILNYVETVWRDIGSRHPEIGLELAEGYSKRERPSDCVRILTEMVDAGAGDEEVVVNAIRALTKVEQFGEGRKLVERFKEKHASSTRFLAERARLVLSADQDIEEIFSDDSFSLAILRSEEPVVALRLVLRGGNIDEAFAILDDLIGEEEFVHGPQARYVFREFEKQGLGDQFLERVATRLPRRSVQRFLELVSSSSTEYRRLRERFLRKAAE